MADSIKVFCSHSSADNPRVKAVAKRLAAAGIDPWVDQWEIAPGDDIVGKINEGLATSNVGLIFFSKETLEKRWVRAEVSNLTYQAIEDGKPVIPVMLDADAPVPELLRSRARIAGDDLEPLIDAIYGRSGEPRVTCRPYSSAGSRISRFLTSRRFCFAAVAVGNATKERTPRPQREPSQLCGSHDAPAKRGA
jgi:hypothetical protein